jgi:hypothetical protein
MKQPLMGHCVAAPDPWKIVVAGGFSSIEHDYVKEAHVYDTRTKEWYTKPWTKLTYGPSMDSSCITMSWNGKRHIILAGGWNNSALYTTELFDLTTLKWKGITKQLSDSQFILPLPFSLRSSVIGELNKTPILAGGVKCQG